MSDYINCAVEELLKSLIEAAITIKEFGEKVERLERTLHDLLGRIEGLKEDLSDQDGKNSGSLEKLSSMLKKGEELKDKCLKVPCWNFWDKFIFSQDIVKLDEELKEYAALDAQIDILVDVKSIHKKMDKILETMNISKVDSTSMLPELPHKVVGLSRPLEELKSILFRDDISVVGICAPGGCGKTLLTAMLCMEDEVKGRFKDNIIFLTVSNKPDLLEISRRLWGKLLGDKAMPGFMNDGDALLQLIKNLRESVSKPTLVVLDDVWSEESIEKLNLKSVPAIKTVVTTRSMLKNLDVAYTLKMLGKTNAMALFSDHAFTEDPTTEQPDHELVEKIVEGCKGFPLALKLVGCSLRGRDNRTWRSTAQKFEDGKQVFDVQKNLLHYLSPSLDSLTKQHLDCFMDLSAFPQDRKMPVAALVDIWAELYSLNEDDTYIALQEMSRRSLITLLARTRDDAGDKYGNMSDLYVLQYDLLRDLAIYKCQEENPIKQNKRLIMNQKEDGLPKSWTKIKNQSFVAQFVSIHTGEMSPLSWRDISLPEAEVLILHFSSKSYSLPTFLANMVKLKVLIVINYDSSPAELSGLPPPTSFSQLKTVRFEKILLPIVFDCEKPFAEIEKLAFVSCEVRELPGGDLSNIDISATFPSLKELEIDYCNNLIELPSALCSMTELEKLSITNCPDLTDLPNDIGNLENLKLSRFQACTSLKSLPDSLCKLANLEFLDLSHCSSIEELPEDFGELAKLNQIDMAGCLQITYLPESIENIVGLKKVICDEDIVHLWEAHRHSLDKPKIIVAKQKVDLDWLK